MNKEAVERAQEHVKREHANFLGQMYVDNEGIHYPYHAGGSNMEIIIDEEGTINYYFIDVFPDEPKTLFKVMEQKKDRYSHWRIVEREEVLSGEQG